LTIVVDNSMALAWTLADEQSESADVVLDQIMSDGGHVPFIFRAEFANGLTMAIRRGRIDGADREEALVFIETLRLIHDLPQAENVKEAARLADVHLLTVYDALYLELARRRRLPLATFDKKLSAAARAAGVALTLRPDE
jgi:predicted nucleic acid-binding protein